MHLSRLQPDRYLATRLRVRSGRRVVALELWVDESLVEEFNEQSRVEIEKTRDFVILHYHVTEREDTEFWRHCRHMQVPDSLAHRIALFRENAFAYQGDSELFRVDSWSQVLLGQRVVPKSYHHFARSMDPKELTRYLGDFRQAISQTVSRMPIHQDFVNQYCKAEQSVWN